MYLLKKANGNRQLWHQMIYKMALIEIKDIGIRLPKQLFDDLNIFIDDMINSECDIVIVLDGKEGTGKSRNGRIIGKYISYVANIEFNSNNIHFDTKSYIKRSESSKKFTVNILDESRQALNNMRKMSSSNVFFTNWLSENRDKQQAHIIILPAIHDLDTYISLWRMSLLIRSLKYHRKDSKSHSGYKLVRGYCKVYENNKELQKVLFNRKKYGYYSYPQPKYMFKMPDQEPLTDIELQAYKDKKAKQRAEKYSDPDNHKETKQTLGFKTATYEVISKGLYTQKDWAKINNMDSSNISRIMTEYNKKLENQNKENENEG